MKTGEVIERSESLYNKGTVAANSRLSKRHIYSALLTARSILIRQQSNKNQSISQWVYQTLPCVELIPAPVHECPCIPTNGCVILRTKYKLPKPISDIEGSLIQSITSLDGKIIFSETTLENQKYELGNKYTAKKPKFFINNGYAYITVLTLLKAVTISLITEDFLEAKNFPSYCGPCEDCECEDILETEFPIDMDLIKPLLDIANEELIFMFKQMTEDNKNNAKDDSGTTGSMIHQPKQ